MDKLLFFDLVIPTWQIVVCVAASAFLMLSNRLRFAVITLYLFVIFWLYHLFRSDLLALIGGDTIAIGLYSIFGIGLGALAVYCIVAPESSDLNHPLVGPEMANLRRALLKRIDKMESAIKEAESKAMTEVRDSEEQKQDAESKAALLQAQLEEKAEILRNKETALKELESSLQGKILELEEKVQQRDQLLSQKQESSNSDTTDLEGKAMELQARLLDTEDSLRAREEHSKQLEESLNTKIRELEEQLTQKELLLENGDNTKQLEEVLNSKIHELENQLSQKESLLEQHDGETNGIRTELEQRAVQLETQLQEKEAVLKERESVEKQLEESLSSKINELEAQLREKEDLLEKLRREGFEQQQIMGELEGLKAELEERNSALQAKEMEVRMIKEAMPEKARESEPNSAERGERKSRLRSFLASLEEKEK